MAKCLLYKYLNSNNFHIYCVISTVFDKQIEVRRFFYFLHIFHGVFGEMVEIIRAFSILIWSFQAQIKIQGFDLISFQVSQSSHLNKQFLRNTFFLGLFISSVNIGFVCPCEYIGVNSLSFFYCQEILVVHLLAD